MNGSKNYTTMKKYIKIYALLAMALFVGACEDELGNSFEPVQIVSGEEIIFGASYRSASADKAPADRTTRTAYGDTRDDRKWIEINWVAGDRMQIASPISVGVANGVAEYKVQAFKDSDTNGGESTVTELVRAGAAGLQWGPIDEGTVYDFYAVYPSVNQLKESSASAAADGCSLTKEGILTGYLPTDQTCTNTSNAQMQDERWSFSPEMNYAYMVAKSSYTVDSFDEEGAAFMDEPINLQFESLVTALQFEIKAGHLSIPNSQAKHIEIISVAVFSQSGQQLAGDFEYDIKADGTEDEGLVNPGTATYSQVIQKFNGFGTPVTLNNEDGSALDLTFFLLPSVKNYASGDLKLQVVYVIDGVTQIKTATIGTEIPARVKRYFKDVVLPSHTTDVDASVWFQALNPNILVSQVSIPVAANTFANSNAEYATGLNQYLTQQTLTIEEMWNMGVRGFEMVNRAHDSGTTLGNMVASEKEQSAAGTFIDNVKLLRSKQLASFTYDKGTIVSGDPLILLCTYSAVSGGYDPDLYVKKLFASLDALVGSTYTVNGVTTDLQITENTFVQLTANSTVKDVMGKICVIVRPGDDERWAYENPGSDSFNGKTVTTTELSPYGYTYSLKNSTELDANSKWWNKVLIISDWGMDSWDSWHRRFGEAGYYYCATSATNFDKITSGRVSKDKMEAYIIGEKTSMPDDAPKTRQYYYSHDLSNGQTAYVQDMVRIVQEEKGFTATKTTEVGLIGSKTYDHTVNWPESLSEKKKAIDGLFKLAVDTKGGSENNDIYINNLSGYYITGSHEVSWYPAYYLIVRGGLGNASSKEVFSGNSKGGNYKDCADALTEYVYGILSGGTMASGSELAEGPWGLVMMDYIGSATKSKELVNLIMMNNFAGFELAEKKDENKAKTAKVPLNDEKISPELDVLINWD